MSRSHFTALAAALALGAFALRLMAQDTSSTTGAVDTSSSGVSPGAAGAGSDTSGAAGGAVSDSMAPAGGDTSGMQGRRPRAENGGSADSGGGTKPSN